MTLKKGASEMSRLVLGMEDDEVIQTHLLIRCDSRSCAGMSDRHLHSNFFAARYIRDSPPFVTTTDV